MADLVAHSALGGREFEVGVFAMMEGKLDPAAGLAHIEVSGVGTLDLLGVAGITHGAEGELTTRLAALRVTIRWGRASGEAACIAVERFSADYLWHWLVAKARIEASAKARIEASS
ncbi:hypothetical protein KX816_11830 [Sphingosinicellaceae bacterium]|nr:hypothetical protein KX816_11830 [Sphingosinicellaceae bacterium]